MKIPENVRERLKIQRPILLLDASRAQQNIRRMLQKATSSGAMFRPHFKTHQSAAIATWFRDQGVHGATVSSLDMALYFASAGWKNLTVAFPLNLQEMDKVVSLAARIELHLIVDSPSVLEPLAAALRDDVSVWIKVDVGSRRAGILWNDRSRLVEIAQLLHSLPRLNFGGILAHAGHSYNCSSIAEVREVHHDSLMKLTGVRDMLEAHGHRPCRVSIGDTPTASVVDSFSGIDELRPGNFVFYDLMQLNLGVCAVSNLALGVACPVVGLHQDRNQVLIYGGAVHFSKESTLQGGVESFGRLARFRDGTWNELHPGANLISLSQEHGIIQFPTNHPIGLEIGDVVVILPVHACLTADLYPFYLTLEGEILPRRTSNAGTLPDQP